MKFEAILPQLDGKYDVTQYMVIRKDFLDFISEMNGVLFDAERGFRLLSNEIGDELNALDKQLSDFEIEELEYHLKAALSRNWMHKVAPEGRNSRFVGNYCIVALYQFWDENIRQRIAQVFGVEIIEITHPIFGEVRHIRNAIIHNHGIATTDVENNRVFSWFKRGESINIDREKYVDISRTILEVMLEHQLIRSVDNDLAEALLQYRF